MVPSLQPVKPEAPPLVPVDRACLDKLESLTILVTKNATDISSLIGLADRVNKERESTSVAITQIQQQLQEHSHDTVEPQPVDLDALADEVIKRLPPFTVWSIDDVTGEETPVSVKLGGEFEIHTTIPK